VIPLATTTISIERRGDESANYEAATLTAVAAGVRAHIGTPAGTEFLRGGTRETVTFHLDCDPVELDSECEVVDDQTGERYQVIWAKARRGLGLDHVAADLRQVSGVANV
jgi:hypothetical protein